MSERKKILLVRVGGYYGIDKPIWKGDRESLTVEGEDGKRVYVLANKRNITGGEFVRATRFGGEFWNFYEDFDKDHYYGYVPPGSNPKGIKEGEKYDILFFTIGKRNSVYLIGFYRDATLKSADWGKGEILKRDDGGKWTHYDLLPEEYFKSLDSIIKSIKDKKWLSYLKSLQEGYEYYKNYRKGKLSREEFEAKLDEIFKKGGHAEDQYRRYHFEAPKNNAFLIEPSSWVECSGGKYPFQEKRTFLIDLERKPEYAQSVKEAVDEAISKISNRAIRDELDEIRRNLAEVQTAKGGEVERGKSKATGGKVPIVHQSTPIILYGPPGTGKTWAALRYPKIVLKSLEKSSFFLLERIDKIWNLMKGGVSVPSEYKEELCKIITFHKSYSYEDFVEGIRPQERGEKIVYRVVDGPLKRAAWLAISLAILEAKEDRVKDLKEAAKALLSHLISSKEPSSQGQEMSYKEAKEKLITALRSLKEDKKSIFASAPPVFLIIDEINRGDISRVFGEMITIIEDSKRIGQEDEVWIELLYSKELLCLPPNLYILGTMNSADRSIALIDYALRRRFKFIEVYPEDGYDLIKEEDAKKLLEELNKRIVKRLGRDYAIGFTYFCGDEEKVLENFKTQIIPLLVEYFYTRPSDLKEVLGNKWFDEKIIEIDEESGVLKKIDWEKFDKEVKGLKSLLKFCEIESSNSEG